MRDDQIKYIVDRFLGWRLPENFNPDGGISFKKTFNDHLPTPTKYNPSGTNIFDASQAEAMVRYILDGLPEAPAEQLLETLKMTRPFVEYAYQAEDGEEAAEAKHVLDKIDAILGGKETENG